MQISIEGKIGIGLSLLALGGAGALAVAAVPLITIIGWAMIGIAMLGGVLLGYHHFIHRSEGAPPRQFNLTWLVLLAIVSGVCFIVWRISPHGPALGGEIDQIAIAWNGPDPSVPAYAYLFVTISNTGSPSVAGSYIVDVEVNGKTYDGMISPLPDILTLAQSRIRIFGKDDLLRKASSPIQPGDFTQGILMVNFSNLNETLLRLGKYTLKFNDVAGYEYTFTTTPTAEPRSFMKYMPKIDIQRLN